MGPAGADCKGPPYDEVGTSKKLIPGGRKCFLMMFLDFLQKIVGGHPFFGLKFIFAKIVILVQIRVEDYVKYKPFSHGSGQG